MAKIYPDTNRFVDFYQAASEKLNVFDQLQAYKEHLVLTEQTIVEFRRNRVSTLKWLSSQFKKTMDIAAPYTTAVLLALPEHDELTKLRKAYQDKGKEITKHLETMIEDEKKDPVTKKFLALVTDHKVERLPLTDDAIKLAQMRKLLGNPPCSPDKHTIGDEVIWELLIKHAKDDLIIVTKDHTFHDNIEMLKDEYKKKTKHKLLLVTDTFSAALKAIGEHPTNELIEVEKKEEQLLSDQLKRSLTMREIVGMYEWEKCPICGKKGSVNGYEGADGDEAAWFICAHCKYLHMI